MGVVLMAYDPQLDRRVAIKLLHPSRSADPKARQRLLREAQALAKLSHPNVVQIYDAGTHGDRVYLAMELVDGETLDAWLSRQPRPRWREIVDVFVAAGEGLAAAHAAGLVHRDFKPHNALVGKDGRVRVLDFGLVRVERRTDESARTEETPPHEIDASVGAHTKTGELLGTPAFMAPEQFRGEVGDERTDQYNFCASLFYGLWGVRPHPGDSVPEIMQAALAGTLAPRPSGSDVPAKVEQAVLRGLRSDPEARHPSLAALLAELQRRPARNGWKLALLAAIGGVAVGAIAVSRGRQPSALDRCRAASDAAGRTWAKRRPRIERAFSATELVYAADSFARLDEGVDEWLGRWKVSHASACEAAHATATESAAMLDLRVACLQRAHAELEAAAEVLESADAIVVRRSHQLVDGLPRPSHCDDIEALAAAVPPPQDAATRDAVVAVRKRVARATALDRAGRYADAADEARAALADADAVAYPPAVVEATYWLAEAQSGLGEIADADRNMRKAYWGALAGRVDDLAYATARRMVDFAGVRAQKFDEAELWWQTADAIRVRIDAEPDEEGRLTALHALLKQIQGEHEEALGLYEQALPLVERPALKLKILNDRGDLYFRMGKLEQAGAAFGEAYEQAVEIYGAKHPDTALPLGNRGMIALQREDFSEAVEQIERAIAVLEPAVAEGNPHLASMFNMLGVAAERQEQYDEARAQFRRALEIREKAFGPEHGDVAMIHANLGRLAWAERRNEDAIAEYEKALAIYERVRGPDSPDLSVALTGIASAYWELGRLDDAIPPFERALAIQSRDDLDPSVRARTQFLLARTLWDRGDRARATELAKAAHVTLAEPGAPSEPKNALAAWSRDVGLDLD